MTTFTKFTALAVAALVMASTSAMALTATPVSRNVQVSSNMPEIYGINGPVNRPTLGTQNYLTGLGGFTNTQRGLATVGNQIGNIGNAAGVAAAGGYLPNQNREPQFDMASQYITGYRAGVASSAASMRAGAGGGLGGLGGLASGISGIGGFGGANCGAGGASAALCNLSGGLGQLGSNLRLIEGVTGVNLGGRTLMNAAGYANIAGGVTNGQNWTNLGNNLAGSVNQFGTGITQSVNQIGSAFGRRTPVPVPGEAATATHEATHGTALPPPAEPGT